MTTKRNTVLYTGVSGELKNRVYQHKEKLADGFTKRYNVTKLVWYAECENAYAAIGLEKRIKAGSRQKKIDLINSTNPYRQDLYDEL